MTPFRFSTRGVKFRLYAQPPGVGFAPETVRLRAHPGTIAAGPVDRSIRVIDAAGKYSYRSDDTLAFRRLPPYPRAGPRHPPARPDRDGHFDHLEPGTRPFAAAAVFAVVRIVLEIWEHHLGQPIPWHFRESFGPRLELIPLVRSNNAWSGDGYLELGYPGYPDPHGRTTPFCLNFEVVAHETGHLILKSVIGSMPDDEKSLQYRAHEEAAADLIATLGALHFDSVVSFVLERTRGKLFSTNPASRIGEWGPTRAQTIRSLYNDATMASARRSPTLDKYRLAAPFEGAVFDVFVEVFESKLVERGAISRSLARRSRHAPHTAMRALQDDFARRYRDRASDFRAALVAARDELTGLLAETWRSTPRDGLTFARVLAHMLDADRSLSGSPRGRYSGIIEEAFARRGILPDSGR